MTEAENTAPEQRGAAVAALAEAIRTVGRSGPESSAQAGADGPSGAAAAGTAGAGAAGGGSSERGSTAQGSAASGTAGTGVPEGTSNPSEGTADPSDGTSAQRAQALRAAAEAAGAGAAVGASSSSAVADAQRAEALRAAAEVLAAGGAPAEFAAAAVAELGEGAARLLREDPWAVLALPGVRPEQADGFARGLLGPAAGPGDPRRAQALVPWLLEQAALRGHSAQEIGEIATGLEKLGLPDPGAALQAVVTDGRVMAFQEELPGRPGAADEDEEPPTRTMLALERLALAEESLAEALVRVMATLVPGDDEEYEAARAAGAVDVGTPAAGADTVQPGELRPDATTTADVDAVESATAEPGAESADVVDSAAHAAGADAVQPGGLQPDATAEPGTTHADAADVRVADSAAARPGGPVADSGGGSGPATASFTGSLAAQDGPPAGPPAGPPVPPGPAAWEAAATAAPSSSAAALVRAVAESALVAHTGGEASRAELAALLDAAHGLGLRVWAAAWTDQGAAALTALLGGSPAAPRVSTLARLLTGSAGPARAEDGTLALDLLLVPDAPLLDIESAATLLEALGDGTRLVLSGDPGQLWSAGPGRFFADLLAAKLCPVVASRTPDFGPIGELVSGVGIGELLSVDAPEKEVVILTARDGGEAVHRAVQLLGDSIPRALGIPAEQVVLLTPGHAGPAGTRSLNAAAKARLNPGPGRFGGFDPGDRVVHSPALGVNQPGRVVDGDASGLHLELSDGSRLTLSPAQAARLRHGWALTAHQAVGRRWPAVVVVLPEDAGPGLTRQWVYTAFGRAERHLSVVHAAGQALAQAVAERPAQPRTTRLRAILAEQTGQAY